MGFLDSHRVAEREHGLAIALEFGFAHELGIHLLELVVFPGDGDLQVRLGVGDAVHDAQVGMGVDRLGRRCRAEQPGDLRESLGVGLGRERKVFPIRLTLARESRLKIVAGCHRIVSRFLSRLEYVKPPSIAALAPVPIA